MADTLVALAALLAKLFPDEASSLRIMAAVGVEAGRINSDQPARTRWYFIVSEAERAGLLYPLVEFALSEYPEQVDLRRIDSAMRRAQLGEFPLTVLAIWPTPPGEEMLDQAGEAEAMYAAGIDYVALEGDEATRDNLVREWGRMEPQVVAFGAHGKDGKIFLTDGPIDTGWIGRLAIDHQPELILLLTCESSSEDKMDMADALIDEGVKAVITVSGSIEDAQVILFERSFYRYYGRGDSLRHSFDRAKLSLKRESAQMIRLRQRS